MKIRNLPECQVYNSVLFSDFDTGVACLHEVRTAYMGAVHLPLVRLAMYFGNCLRIFMLGCLRLQLPFFISFFVYCLLSRVVFLFSLF